MSFSNVWKQGTECPCSKQGHPTHLAGQCQKCNCGEDEKIHPQWAIREMGSGTYSDTENKAITN